MAAKLALSSGVTTQIPIPPKSSSVSPQVHDFSLPKRFDRFKLQANIVKESILGVFSGRRWRNQAEGKKKFITKDEEPEQYWQTAGVREGESPMKTPLPYIIIFGLSTPFVILAIVFANGWIKVRAR